MALGIVILLLVDVIWVASSELTSVGNSCRGTMLRYSDLGVNLWHRASHFFCSIFNVELFIFSLMSEFMSIHVDTKNTFSIFVQIQNYFLFCVLYL